MSQQTPALGSRSIPTTPPTEISSMPTTPLQLSELDAVSNKRTRDLNAVPNGRYPPNESRTRRSLTCDFESTTMESQHSTHAHHRKESPCPDEQKKLKPDTKKVNQSPKAKIPELTHDRGNVEEETRAWIKSINKKLAKATRDNEECPWAKLCIYWIPPQLLDADDKYTYLPQAVTLGPYKHHITDRVKDMKFHKWRALERTLKRTEQPIEHYLNGVKELEGEARACYEGKIDHLQSNQFIEMMVLDSCFILDIFRGAAHGHGFTKLGYQENDPVFAMRATMHLIRVDMVMLENQIPLFVLDRILGLQNGDPNQKGIVSQLAINFFKPLTPTDEPKTPRNEMNSDSIVDGLHCLEVFRRYLLDMPTWSKQYITPKLGMWTDTNTVADKRQQPIIHCAIELREAGIKFKRMKTDRFWDIRYKKGVLKIPRLLIHDGTKSLLLNLIAFERCHVDCTNHVTAYVIFMDNLIGTAADVSFLHRHGIIEHWLGNDQEVADLFSQLNRTCQEVVFDRGGNYLSSVSKEVNKYYNGKWNNWVANLNHTYFTNPWTTISLLAAGSLLLLTLAQTFYTVYGYYRPT